MPTPLPEMNHFSGKHIPVELEYEPSRHTSQIVAPASAQPDEIRTDPRYSYTHIIIVEYIRSIDVSSHVFVMLMVVPQRSAVQMELGI
jgi:hypothetical protein